ESDRPDSKGPGVLLPRDPLEDLRLHLGARRLALLALLEESVVVLREVDLLGARLARLRVLEEARLRHLVEAGPAVGDGRLEVLAHALPSRVHGSALFLLE